MNNNIDLTDKGSVKIGDTLVNNDGITITGGPTITKNNVDMGGQQIHNVKSGGDVDSNGANVATLNVSPKLMILVSKTVTTKLTYCTVGDLC